MQKDPQDETSPPRYKTSNVILLSINAALGAVFFGYVLSVFNPTQRYIQEKVYPGISEHLIYLMTSFIPLGGAFGAITATSLASKYGRRKIMLLIDILSIVGIILTIIPNQYVLLVGRLVCGVCIGLNSSLVPLYISEVSPLELKGITGTFNQVFVSIGILVSYLLGLGIPSDDDAPYSNWWMFMLGVILFAPVIRFIVLGIFVRHETPKFLVQKHKDGEARDALAQMYRDRDEIEAQLEQIRKEIRYEEAKDGVTYKDLISPYYRRRFVTGCVLAILQQACGINAIILYSTDIFRRGVLVSEDSAPQVYTVVVGVINLLSAMMATVFVTGTGRRTLLIIGNILLFLSLIVLSIAEFVTGSPGELSRYCIFLFILAFGFSLGSVTWFYLAEILPDLGIGVALLCNWVMCFIIAQGFPYMVDAIVDAGSFLIFGGICIAGLVFVVSCVEETRNKNSMEIADMFSKKKFTDNSEEAGLLAEEKRTK